MATGDVGGLFYRLETDQRVVPVRLEDFCAGPTASACWLIGGGPALDALPCDEIARAPIPKMCVNLAGTRKLRPNYWTSYDPTVRFHRSIYLDPGVIKFVHRRRAMDLVPETTFKVCECPATLFFDREPGRGFADLLAPASRGVVDWADSFVQALDILFRLGFRTLYLAGCDMRIRPSDAQRALAAARGVEDRPLETLADFVKRCQERGLSCAELEQAGLPQQYHFDEVKPLAAAVQTDAHYFRIAQSLRLSRRCLARAGLQLISVTPGSRLNDYFPYRPVETVLADIAAAVGDPAVEPTRGLYTQRAERWSHELGPMRDVRPPNWPAEPRPPVVAQPPPDLLVEAEGWERAGRKFQDAYVAPPEEG